MLVLEQLLLAGFGAVASLLVLEQLLLAWMLSEQLLLAGDGAVAPCLDGIGSSCFLLRWSATKPALVSSVDVDLLMLVRI